MAARRLTSLFTLPVGRTWPSPNQPKYCPSLPTTNICSDWLRERHVIQSSPIRMSPGAFFGTTGTEFSLHNSYWTVWLCTWSWQGGPWERTCSRIKPIPTQTIRAETQIKVSTGNNAVWESEPGYFLAFWFCRCLRSGSLETERWNLLGEEKHIREKAEQGRESERAEQGSA